jgi:hypothetical protein
MDDVNLYRLQALVKSLIPGRIRICMKWFAPESNSADVYYREKVFKGKLKGVSFVRGVMRCGSIWVCPVCANHEVKNRIARLMKCQKFEGLNAVFMTFTLQHNLEDSLECLIRRLNQSVRYALGGRGELGGCGSINALEIRYSKVAGWHPHKHFILFYKDFEECTEKARIIRRRFIDHLAALGGYSNQVDIEYLEDLSFIPAYIAKMSSEISGGFEKEGKSKDSMSVWQLLDYSSKLFGDYVEFTRGLKQFRVSAPLARLIGWNKEVEKVVMEDLKDEDVLMAQLSIEEWLYLYNNKLVGQMLTEAKKGALLNFQIWLQQNIKIMV